KAAPPRRRRRWPAVAAGALAAALLVAAAAAVYTFRTANGTIEISTDDPDVTVSVMDRGKKDAILDGKTGRKVVVVPAGEYDLVLDDNGKRLELATDRVKVTRNGKA